MMNGRVWSIMRGSRGLASLLAAGLIIGACAGRGAKEAEATAPAERVAGPSRGSSDARSLPSFDVSAGAADLAGGGDVLGASKELPVPTCGASHSYEWIASDARCGDGRNPLQGDLRAAMASRAGNVGPNASGHIIDLYEIPCPEGPKKIYVDMYDCENAEPTRAEVEIQRLMAGVVEGDHEPFIRRCREEEAGRSSTGRVSALLKACVSAMPAALDASGDREGAKAWLREWCAGAELEAEPGEDPKRFVYLDNVIESSLSLALEVDASAATIEAARGKLVEAYAPACGVDRAAFETWRASAAG
ncbi:MAG: hypothetical protein R3A79_15520 [Nannocystaceae bacterium]